MPPPVVLKKTPSLDSDAYSASASQRRSRVDAADTAVRDPRDSLRLDLLHQELDAHRVVTVSHEVAGSMAEKAMLKALQTAVDIVNDIYALQVNGNNLIWRRQIMQSGTEVEKTFTSLFFRPWCQIVKDDNCNAVASLPRPETGTVFWPVDFNTDAPGHLQRMINAKELLSPFSLVVRDGGARMRPVPYPNDPRFAALFASLSSAFETAASGATDKTAGLLRQLAEMTTAGDIFTFGMDDEIFHGGEGTWRIYWDAGSATLDPLGVKHSFGLTVARVDDAAQLRLQILQQRLSAIRDAYQSIFTPYSELNPTAVELQEMPQWTPLDVWLAAGRVLDEMGESSGNPGIDRERRVLMGQPYLENRMKYLSMFQNVLFESTSPAENGALGMSILSLVERLVPSSLVPLSLSSDATDTAAAPIKSYSPQFQIYTLNLLKGAAAIWIVQQLEKLSVIETAAVPQCVAMVIADLMLQLETADGAKQLAIIALLNDWETRGALTVDTRSGGVVLNSKQILLAGGAVFETLSRIISVGDEKALLEMPLTAQAKMAADNLSASAELQTAIGETWRRAAVSDAPRFKFDLIFR